MKLATVQNASAQTGVSTNTIYAWVYAGRLKREEGKISAGGKTYFCRAMVDVDEVMLLAKKSKRGVKMCDSAILACIEMTEPQDRRTHHSSIWNRARRELAAINGNPVGVKSAWCPKKKGWVK